MKFFLISALLLLSMSINLYAQDKVENNKKDKIFISAGYGLAGSFFVRSYDEFAPTQRYKIFYKKKFVGVAQNLALGINLKKNYQIKFGINFQHFTRKIKFFDTLNGVIIILDHTIHHRDYMWFAGINKKYERKKHIFSPGLGIYYLRPKQEEVEIYPNLVINQERDFNNSRLNEGGVFAEFEYEYKFQPKVNIGIKTQFYFTLSAGYSESITLFPYIKITL